jgi:hypothetical protein
LLAYEGNLPSISETERKAGSQKKSGDGGGNNILYKRFNLSDGKTQSRSRPDYSLIQRIRTTSFPA